MAENPNSSRLDVSVNVSDNATPQLRTIESGIIRFVGAVSSALAVFSTAIFPIKQAADFQAELLNVAKTTNFTDDQIAALRRNLIGMSADISLSAVELAKIAAIAGQLGVGGGVKGITAFTETTARFASVIDVSVEQAGNGLAKLTNVFKTNVQEVERLSSLVNELSNNSTASGEELLDIMNRIGTAGGTLNVKQAGALAALGRDLGVSVETIGTSFQKIFLDLQTKADKVAPLLGVTVDQFTTKLKGDGVGALKDYINALSQLPPSVQAAFAEETTGGGRVFGLVNNLINDAKNGFELLDARLKNAEDGFEGGTSAIREQQRVMQGLNAQIKLVMNAFSALVISVGDKAIPTLTALARTFQEFLRDPATVDRLGQFADSLGSILSFVGGVISGIAQMDFVLGPLLRALQIFLAFKLVSYLFDMAQGLLRVSRDARGAAAAFIALARGQTTVAEAAERAAAAQAAQAAGGAAGRRGAALSGLSSAVGGALGAIPAEQARRATQAAEAQATAEAAVTAQRKAQADLQALIDQRRGFALATQREYLALDAAIAAQRRVVFDLEQRIAFVRAGNVDAQGASLRSLNAQLLVAREILATDELHLQTRIQELRVQGGLVTAATAEARAKVASAAAAAAAATAQAATAAAAAAEGATAVGLSRIGGLFRGFAASVGSVLSRLFSFITGPIGFVVITITTLLASFGLLDKAGEVLARFFGISNTAGQAAERRARASAAAADLEAQRIKQLAAEYDGLQKKIQNFDPNQAEQAIKSGDPAKFLKSISTNVEIVQAKIATTVSEIGLLSAAGGNVEISFNSTTGAIQRTEEQIASLENSLRNVDALATASPLFGSASRTKQGLTSEITAELEAARAKLAQLQQERAGFAAAMKGVLDDQAAAQSAIPRLLAEENRLLQGAAPLYTEQANSLLAKAAAVARVREQLQAQKKIEDDQKNAGAKDSTDPKVIAEAAATQERIRLLKAELVTVQTQLNGLTNEAGPKAKAFIEAFGDGMKNSSKDIERNAALFQRAFSLDQGQIQIEFEKANNELDKSRRKLLELRAVRARNDQIAAIAPQGAIALALNNESAGIDREIIALQSKIALRQAELDASRQQLALGAELRALAERSAISDREVLRTRVQAGIQAGAQKIQLQAVERAQSAIADAAKRTAEVYKSSYERAANAAASAVFDATRRIAQFQQSISDRAKNIELVKFDSKVLADQRTANNEAARLTREFEKQLDLQGLEGEERQAALDAYRQEADRKEEIRVKQQEINRIQVEYNAALATARAAEQEIIAGANTRIVLEERLAKAKKEGNGDTVALLTAQLDTLNAKTKATQTTLEKTSTTIAELGAKVVSGEFIPPVSPIDPAKAEADLKKIGEIAARGATEVAAQAKTLSDQATANSTAAATALETTKQALVEIQQAIQNAANFTGLSVAAFENAGRKILADSAGYAQAAQAIERIANLDFSTGITLPDVGALNKAIQLGEIAIRDSATSVSTIIDNLSNGAIKNLGAAFKEALAIDINETAIQRRIEEQQKNLRIQIDSITFPSAAEALKSALTPGGQPLKVPIELTGDPNVPGAIRRAGGGPVFGPGTSTSDSILARLSHGEYVSDARTTGAFGTGFFSLLKSIAHNGPSSVAQFLSTFGSVPLPRFATGGAVSMGSAGSTMVANGPTDTVRVVLDVGGKSVSMFGQRDQADQLVRTLKNLGRSA